jgi:multiple sugar transport system permease protein
MRFAAIAFLVLLPILALAKTEVSFLFCYDPNIPETPTTRRILEFAREEQELEPVKWGGLVLPGAGGRATFMLSLAGGTAPDIYTAWFHILRHDVEQGFVYPLDEWVAPPKLPAGVAEHENLWDRVRCHKGKVWALPAPSVAYYGIVYRKDIVKAAGLDPEKPPRTWDEFRDWCVKLTIPGRRAFAIENRPWGFLPWVQSAGGDVIGNGKASFDSEECVKAAEYLQSLKRLGVIRGMPVLTVADDLGQLFVSGEIVAVFGGEDLVIRLTETLNFPGEHIGIMPFPAVDENNQRVLQAHRHFYAMSESAGRRPKAARDLVFRCLEKLASPELADEEVHRNVAQGRQRWCKPSDLMRLGYEKEVADLPLGIRQMYADLDAGKIRAVTEPWVGFWQGASDLMQRKLLGILLSDAGDKLDCRAALREINAEANSGLMFDADKTKIERARPYARVILGVFAIAVAICAFMVWNDRRRRKNTASSAGQGTFVKNGMYRFVPWFFLAPALLSILTWSYYPLLKGALMAFQNYHIVGAAEWAGLDNFIRVATDPNFWTAWLRTLQYVIITLILGFLTPIVLAVMLSEIPRGKIFFRFLYFLPHLTSALVVTLLWKLMFDPTENGILNQILASLGMARQSWLQDPSLAMVCCIIPGVWAGAGMASLIYIAALGSLPQDYYEAAAIDGAGFLARLRHVTLPQLAPLMVINFVGAFIAAFQGMGSIFLLTFGGPGDATQVLSLTVWKEAYNNLRFSTATTMAWFLGVALIGFTYLQIRFLRKVEFRQAAIN